MVRRLERRYPAGDDSFDQSTSRYKAVLCAQLVKEYLTTVVNLLMSVDASWKNGSDSDSASSADYPSEINFRVILSVSARQIFRQLQNVQTELARLREPAQGPDSEDDLRHVRTLIDEAESMLFILFNGFAKAGLAELEAEDGSESSVAESSDGDRDDYGSVKYNTSGGKMSGSLRLSASAVKHESRVSRGDSDSQGHPHHILLFNMVHHVNKAMARTGTDGIDPGLERGWLLLDMIEGMREGLFGLYRATSAPKTLQDYDRRWGIPISIIQRWQSHSVF
ncbi:hypothetical protein NCC49_002743 [Naganishia albida]|nr:hypothetical protein NCC49_002743 [Naganishia albida]